MSLFDFLGLVTNKKLDQKLSQIVTLLLNIKQKEEEMALNFDALIAQVERNTQIDTSAITLLNGLTAKINQLAADLADQPVAAAKIAELAAALGASTDALVSAVAANTPAEVVDPVDGEPVVE